MLKFCYSSALNCFLTSKTSQSYACMDLVSTVQRLFAGILVLFVVHWISSLYSVLDAIFVRWIQESAVRMRNFSNDITCRLFYFHNYCVNVCVSMCECKHIYWIQVFYETKWRNRTYKGKDERTKCSLWPLTTIDHLQHPDYYNYTACSIAIIFTEREEKRRSRSSTFNVHSQDPQNMVIRVLVGF